MSKLRQWKRRRDVRRDLRREADKGNDVARDMLAVVKRQPRKRRPFAEQAAVAAVLVDAYRRAGEPFGPNGIREWIEWCGKQPPDMIVLPPHE